MQFISSVLIHWVHLIAVATLVGGAILTRVAVHPASELLEGEAKEEFRKNFRRRALRIIHPALLFVILSGLWNFVRRINEGVPTTYHMIFLFKLLAAMAVIFLAAALSVSATWLKQLEARRAHWLTLNALLGILVLLLSAWLRMIPPEIK